MSKHEAATAPHPIDPLRLGAAVTDAYRNESLGPVNDHEIRLSVMTHAFPWHRHPDSDETFMVLEGELVIEFEADQVTLKPGELLTVRRGVLHRTRPGKARSVNLTFERVGATTEFVTPAGAVLEAADPQISPPAR